MPYGCTEQQMSYQGGPALLMLAQGVSLHVVGTSVEVWITNWASW